MPRRGPDLLPLDWETEFIPHVRRWWEPGEHGAVIAPTGVGKTTFVGGLLPHTRRYCMALDPKGGDDTLAGLGWPRLGKCPSERAMAKMLADNDEEGRSSRYIVGPFARTADEKAGLREELRKFLRLAHDMGGWTVYADELQLLTDPRMFNLRREVDEILIAARNWGLSFVSSFQAPSWVTPHASKMAKWCAVSYTRDTDVVNRLAEILGRPKAEIRGALEGMGEMEYTWLVVGRNPREPMVVTRPVYLAPHVREVAS